MYNWSVNVIPAQPGGGRPASQTGGFFETTLVAAEHGWKAVETLRAGDQIWTFDSGLQALADVSVLSARPQSVVRIPQGALANEVDLVFPGDTGFLLECENASDPQGDPFAVVPLDALKGACGISGEPAPQDVSLYALTFERDEVVYIDSGLLVFCRSQTPVRDLFDARYDVRSVDEAKALMTDLDLAELALREPEDDVITTLSSYRVA